MRLDGRFKTTILLALLTALLLFVGNLLGGATGLAIGFAFAILMNFGSYYYSDKIILRMYRAKAAPKNHPLHPIVSSVAKKARIPKPEVYILPSNSPNAFATGRNPNHAAIAATEGILKLLSLKELEGVIAHEAAHIKNRDTLIQTIASTIAGVIGFVATMARWTAIFGGFGADDDGGGFIELIVLGIVTPIMATLLQLSLSRNREYLADKTGASFTGHPEHLSSALKKLHHGVSSNPMHMGSKETSALFITNPFSMKGIAELLSTHPRLSKRVKRLESMMRV
ncbi:MAG: M48 family metalloprotease [Nanobdellota archaeon]